MIRKVAIRNYRSLRHFDLTLTPGLNIVVGANDTGKSTLLEAIGLGLTFRINGRNFAQELNPFYVNMAATKEYIQQLMTGKKAPPPTLTIDIFLEEDAEAEILRGSNNALAEDACGVRVQAQLSPDFAEEYRAFIEDPSSIRLAPTEYYRVDWFGFSGNAVTARSVPATASVVDPSSLRLQAGVDHHLQQILRTHLEPKERVELSRQYRSVRESFSAQEQVKAINARLQADSQSLTSRTLSLGIDISQRFTWENNLTAHLDELPYPFASKGEQSALKTLLALGRKANGAEVILIEEPEAHLSFAHLQLLLTRIQQQCEGKQVVLATHSNFVLNKLGLESMILLGAQQTAMRFAALPNETVRYFQKLPGFDTLRLVLAHAAILVEGPSDELVIQRAYLDAKGKLPIEDGIDVISVGLAHKRFLDIAKRLHKRIWVVTDNDGKPLAHHQTRFADYLEDANVSLHVGENIEYPTLEPQIVAANDLASLNNVLGTTHRSKDDVLKAMLAEKTDAAFAIFESTTRIIMPAYIRDVVDGA
ncbi:ATP-dependent nuclease [Dyella sp. Tek66A03]|uniref:ATP-dependent nuclease n=1 Tax=Dyella sp. Tek66A03 TaxID=3458298 RepID=UPI00403E46E6